MGNYLSRAQLEARFNSTTEVAYLTGDEATGTPDTAVEDDCIESAEAEINARLSVKYQTPVSTADLAANTELSRLLTRKTGDLAEINLRYRGPAMSETRREREARVLEFFDNIAAGKTALPGATTIPSTASKNPLATWSDSSRTLDEDSGRLFSRSTTGGL